MESENSGHPNWRNREPAGLAGQRTKQPGERKEYVYGPTGMLAEVTGNEVNFLTPDHLGSPRVLTSQNGIVVNRRDFFPFGEDIAVGVGGRSAGMGYGMDSLRQRFTGYEKDEETGLDFAEARYYTNTLGRFNSADPAADSALIVMPQSWNRYTYVLNNPLLYVDPDGMRWLQRSGDGGNIEYQWFDETEDENGNSAYQTALGAGWSEVDFNESKTYVYRAYNPKTSGYDYYKLNPNGTHGWISGGAGVAYNDVDLVSFFVLNGWGSLVLGFLEKEEEATPLTPIPVAAGVQGTLTPAQRDILQELYSQGTPKKQVGPKGGLAVAQTALQEVKAGKVPQGLTIDDVKKGQEATRKIMNAQRGGVDAVKKSYEIQKVRHQILRFALKVLTKGKG
ncbi:MAG: RHS repeat-associated core domain-containing protein [Acidobacteria bacterium]|nr:RHS repeat-associated core domain-containing protein [Acidobacteriota bacterium]